MSIQSPRPAQAPIHKNLSEHFQQVFLVVVLVALCVTLSLLSDHFLTAANLKNLIEANSYRLLLAIGMTYMVASGVMDLSAGSAVSLCGVTMAACLQAGLSSGESILIGIIAGIAMGAVNGALIHFSGINFFILTLATSGIYRGISLMVTGGTPITGLGSSFMWWGIGRIAGIQVPVILAAVFLLASAVLLYQTRWGSRVLSLGGNHLALKATGARCGLYRITAHVVMGVSVALTALVITARLASAEPNAGMNMDLDAITAVIMGGSLITGGRASLLGTTVAVLILGIIRNGLTLMSVSSDYQQWITGCLLLASVLLAKIRLSSVNRRTSRKEA